MDIQQFDDRYGGVSALISELQRETTARPHTQTSTLLQNVTEELKTMALPTAGNEDANTD